jgi:hypothetical protein
MRRFESGPTDRGAVCYDGSAHERKMRLNLSMRMTAVPFQWGFESLTGLYMPR